MLNSIVPSTRDRGPDERLLLDSARPPGRSAWAADRPLGPDRTLGDGVPHHRLAGAGGRGAHPAAGFRHLLVPLNGGLAFLPPMRRRLARRMRPVVDFVAEEVAAGRPTLVHCRKGNDRTGAVLAAYLACYRGLTPEEAIRRVLEANPQRDALAGVQASGEDDLSGGNLTPWSVHPVLRARRPL
jgi:hypothetical protein